MKLLETLAVLVETHGLEKVLKGMEILMLQDKGPQDARDFIQFDLATRSVQAAHETIKAISH